MGYLHDLLYISNAELEKNVILKNEMSFLINYTGSSEVQGKMMHNIFHSTIGWQWISEKSDQSPYVLHNFKFYLDSYHRLNMRPGSCFWSPITSDDNYNPTYHWAGIYSCHYPQDHSTKYYLLMMSSRLQNVLLCAVWPCHYEPRGK